MKEYSLEFDESALKEWDAFDGSIRKTFDKVVRAFNLESAFPGK